MKRTYTNLVLLLVFFSVLLAVTQTTAVNAQSPNWLAGWSFRREITITGSTAGAVSNYYINIYVFYGSGTPSGNVFYCNSKCRSDFGDVWFTASDGVTVLTHYISFIVNSSYASFWVRVPSIPASPSTTKIYIYYGNPTATYTPPSNLNNIFLFGQDFRVEQNLNKWTIYLQQGTLNITYSSTEGLVAIVRNPSDAQFGISSNTLIDFSTLKKIVYCTKAHQPGFYGSWSTTTYIYLNSANYIYLSRSSPLWTGDLFKRISNTETKLYTDYNANVSLFHEIVLNVKTTGTSSVIQLYRNNSLLYNNTAESLYSGTNHRINISFYGQSNVDYYFYIMYVFVTNVVLPEPMISSYGNEELITSTVISFSPQITNFALSYVNITCSHPILNVTIVFPGNGSVAINSSGIYTLNMTGIIPINYTNSSNTLIFYFKPYFGLINGTLIVSGYTADIYNYVLYNTSSLTYYPTTTQYILKYVVRPNSNRGPYATTSIPIPKEYHGVNSIAVFRYSGFELPAIITHLNTTHYNLTFIDVWFEGGKDVEYYVVYNINPSNMLRTAVNQVSASVMGYELVQSIPSQPAPSSNVTVFKVDYDSHFLVSGGYRYYMIRNATQFYYRGLFVNVTCSVTDLVINIHALPSSSNIVQSNWNSQHYLIKAPDVNYDPNIHQCRPEIYIYTTATTASTSTESWTWGSTNNNITNYSVVLEDVRNYVPSVTLIPNQKYYATGQTVKVTVSTSFPHMITLMRNDYTLVSNQLVIPQLGYNLTQTIGTEIYVFRMNSNYSNLNFPYSYTKMPEDYVFTIVPSIMGGIPDVVTIVPTTTAVINVSKPSVDVGVLAYLTDMPPEYLGVLNMFILFTCVMLVLIANKVSAGIAVLGVALLLTLMNTISGTEVFNRLVVGLIALIGVLSFFTEVRS